MTDESTAATSITVCHRGPLLIRGDFDLLDHEGNPIDAGRTTIALCRCGHSGRKPFCDGSHKKIFGHQKINGAADE